MKRKHIFIIIGVIIGVGVLLGGIYYTWLITPPALPKDPEEGLTLLDSPRFKRLPKYRQEEYLEHITQLLRKLPSDKRAELIEKATKDKSVKKALREVHRYNMRKMIFEYAKATPEKRMQIIDKTIDFIVLMKKRYKGKVRRLRHLRHRGKSRGQFFKRVVEKGNPQMVGLAGEFFRALHQRMKERGIEPP